MADWCSEILTESGRNRSISYNSLFFQRPGNDTGANLNQFKEICKRLSSSSSNIQRGSTHGRSQKVLEISHAGKSEDIMITFPQHKTLLWMKAGHNPWIC